MTKRNMTKGQKNDLQSKTLHKKLKIEQHGHHNKPGMNSRVRKGKKLSVVQVLGEIYTNGLNFE